MRTLAVKNLHVVAEGLARFDVGEGMQLFTTRKLRKERECKGCGKTIPRGAEAFGEATSCAMNRMYRFCMKCCSVPGIPTLAQCEEALGEPADKWAGRCFEIASRIVKAKLVPGVAVYGHFIGPVHEDSFFGDHVNHPFIQHGWVNLPDGRHVFDPTRWAFEAKKPYLYVGESKDYDEGGNRFRTSVLGPPPDYDPDEKKYAFGKNILSSPAWGLVEQILRINVTEQEPGELTDTQVGWLSNIAFDVLQPHAFEIYSAIAHHGLISFIPIDNRRRAERLAGKPIKS